MNVRVPFQYIVHAPMRTTTCVTTHLTIGSQTWCKFLLCFGRQLHTAMCLVSHKCGTCSIFHVLVILGAAVLTFIHSPFFYPCCAISFAGIVALIYFCIGCTGGASIACWLHWWCIVSHASHTITVTGSPAAVTKNKLEFCMCLPVIILASCFRLHFAVWFEMHPRMTWNNWIFFRMDTGVPKFERNT